MECLYPQSPTRSSQRGMPNCSKGKISARAIITNTPGTLCARRETHCLWRGTGRCREHEHGIPPASCTVCHQWRKIVTSIWAGGSALGFNEASLSPLLSHRTVRPKPSQQVTTKSDLIVVSYPDTRARTPPPQRSVWGIWYSRSYLAASAHLSRSRMYHVITKNSNRSV